MADLIHEKGITGDWESRRGGGRAGTRVKHVVMTAVKYD